LQILCSPTYHPELPVMRKHELYYATWNHDNLDCGFRTKYT
jgi:hypothetical protein